MFYTLFKEVCKKEHLKKYGGRKANRQKYRIAEYKIGQTCQKLWDVCQENDTRDIKMETEYVKNVMGPKYIRIYSCVSSIGTIFHQKWQIYVISDVGPSITLLYNIYFRENSIG